MEWQLCIVLSSRAGNWEQRRTLKCCATRWIGPDPQFKSVSIRPHLAVQHLKFPLGSWFPSLHNSAIYLDLHHLRNQLMCVMKSLVSRGKWLLACCLVLPLASAQFAFLTEKKGWSAAEVQIIGCSGLAQGFARTDFSSLSFLPMNSPVSD